MSARFGIAKITPVDCDYTIGSGVVGLRDPARPATIPRLITAIRISALKRQSRWPWPHISKEVFKLKPALAHGNPAPAVVRPLNNIRIHASPLHRRPNAVFRGGAFAVSRGSVAHCLRLEAATTHNLAAPQVVERLHRLVAAGAGASPIAMAAVAMQHVKRGQSSKCLPCDVVRFCHDF